MNKARLNICFLLQLCGNFSSGLVPSDVVPPTTTTPAPRVAISQQTAATSASRLVIHWLSSLFRFAALQTQARSWAGIGVPGGTAGKYSFLLYPLGLAFRFRVLIMF